MDFISSPYLNRNASVQRIMAQVLVALLPGIAVYAFLIGPVILVQILLASVTALAAESAMLKLRDRPLAPFVTDGSAVVTAWLIALTFPPIAPWWLTVAGTLIAIVIAKHLYGGLGQNPFNPAMVAFAACIVSFPALMSQWPSVVTETHFSDQLAAVFGTARHIDALAGATPLDTLKTALKLVEQGTMLPMDALTGATTLDTPETASTLVGQAVTADKIIAEGKVFGYIAGRSWEWVALAYLLGGLWLLKRGVIRWHAPAGFIAGVLLVSAGCWLSDSARYANPLFHLFSGGVLLGAFFIVTDPVSGCASGKGKLIFGFSAGILAYLIRVFGGYPDGVAFAVLVLNICAPLIDMRTHPPVFGMKKK